MAATYWKVPFEWTARTAPPDDVLADGLSWVSGPETARPVELVANVLASSPGPEDRRAVERLGGKTRLDGHSNLLQGSATCPTGGTS